MDFNLHQGGRYQALPIPGFITVPHGASANTKGAYTQLFAATSFDWRGFLLSVQSSGSGTAMSSLTDIAIGGVGSEVNILPNISTAVILVAGLVFYHPSVSMHYVPLMIPTGVRVAARGQGDVGAGSSFISLLGLAEGMASAPILGRCVSLGTSTVASRGTSITTGAIGVKGAYAQLVTVTPFDIRYLALIGCRSNGGDANYSIDLAIGGVGSEVIVVPDIAVNILASSVMPMFIAIPAGVRLAVRGASQTTGLRTIDISALAFA